MKKSYCLLLVIFCLSLPAKSALCAANQSEIGSIRTAGNRTVSSSDVLSRVRSRVGQLFDAGTADEDAKRIAELDGVEYSYYNTVVVEGKTQLTFVVVEKNLVRSISFIGNHRFKDKKLQKKLDFKIGDWLDAIAAESGRKAVIEFYHKKIPFGRVFP